MKRKKFIVELSSNGMVIFRHFDKLNFYQSKKRNALDCYSQFKNNYYWFIYNRTMWSCKRIKDDVTVYDMLWTDKKGIVTSYGYLDIFPISKKEIRIASKDKRLQGIYDFEILFQPHNGLVRMRGTITKVLRYARTHGLKNMPI